MLTRESIRAYEEHEIGLRRLGMGWRRPDIVNRESIRAYEEHEIDLRRLG